MEDSFIPFALEQSGFGQLNGRVLILGLGDLGKRIAWGLTSRSSGAKYFVHVAARRRTEIVEFNRKLRGSGRESVEGHCIDLFDSEALRKMFVEIEPQVVVHAATLLSPWHLAQRADVVADCLRRAGFALQLSAQLPLLMVTMQALRSTCLNSLVMNCSYPDVTNAILAKLGLSPTIGIGNAGIILGLISNCLSHAGSQMYRVIAHHAHVCPFITGSIRPRNSAGFKVFRNETAVSTSEWSRCLKTRAYTPRVNSFSAWHAVRVIQAFVLKSRDFFTSCPGPFGLPGGWPVHISHNRVKVNLPACISLDEAIECNRKGARLDGVERIDNDGCVHFTSQAKRTVSKVQAKLAKPLHPSEVLNRFKLLKDTVAKQT